VSIRSRRYSAAAALGALVALVLIAVLLAPASPSGPSMSSSSTGASGTRLAYDLLGRFGWSPERRGVPFKRTPDAAGVQVLLQARVGDAEAHELLEFVRGGGSLLVAGDAGPLSDSLPVVARRRGIPVPQTRSDNCVPQHVWDEQLSRFQQVSAVGWKRAAPPDTVGFGALSAEGRVVRPAVGFPLGSGRVVIVPDTALVVNDMIRRCDLQADVTFVRIVEYLSAGNQAGRIAFDEYHHGAGIHGGSFKAIEMYLAGTGSGRMLAQMAFAGLLLLWSAAPRPLSPRDPLRVARRNPLEHAEALARALSSVGATRTATRRLFGGVRRRVRRDRVKGRESDEVLLSIAATDGPVASAAAALVGRALKDPVDGRTLAEVAGALRTVEEALNPRSPRK
jgi:hypothetical protein